MDKSREQFEEFAEREKLSLAYGDCGYVYTSTEMAWRSWQASRAALEIELPDVCAWNLCELLDKKYVVKAITDAGLKVKGE
ncbi:hypothetical protein AUN02_20765 [Cronobacter sakazakii]|uniref:hypothetical protein n=1 Tax=Cronobacter sakazakii TaxID=28141 RepID=UPI000B4AC41B|nr:hypothetical protein [Cronobacter sakazakii]PUW13852.1 hypothetical protein AUM95_06110 [Cronobacter sakazakii]PUW20450.1 hypothetical protein AUN01_18555 [Cronobacter sakazakii]PUW24981.1 hypothetical protein AUN02_20765 [Cronobacter sakazakii]PUW25139.1 hypothetical protein AUN03_22195 [Cronobacter sakazakii]PUW35627.1 hypothetical protein AUN04_12600 [Cronobacter sakazakii]